MKVVIIGFCGITYRASVTTELLGRLVWCTDNIIIIANDKCHR